MALRQASWPYQVGVLPASRYLWPPVCNDSVCHLHEKTAHFAMLPASFIITHIVRGIIHLEYV